MKLTTKLSFFFGIKIHSYSKYVDKFIKSVISRGEYVGRDSHHIHVRLHGKSYILWIAMMYNAGLSDCYCLNGDERGVLYSDKRPSRLTEIRFWQWVEKCDPEVFNDEGRILKALEED